MALTPVNIQQGHRTLTMKIQFSVDQDSLGFCWSKTYQFPHKLYRLVGLVLENELELSLG
jgi:hypothetical protein